MTLQKSPLQNPLYQETPLSGINLGHLLCAISSAPWTETG